MAELQGNPAAAAEQLASEMEVEAYRRLFPLQFFDRHLREGIRPDARSLAQSRPTEISLGPVAAADASALVKIGDTAMLAAIKMEVMTPSADAPDEGNIGVEFFMPPICSPAVRPGRPAEMAPVIAKQLSDAITSFGVIDKKELCLISGKAAWMLYLDIYCLNADGSLFDAALLSAIAAFSHLEIPLVSLNDDGRLAVVSREHEATTELVNKEKRKISLKCIPFSLTCILHEKYILADPTAEEELIMETIISVILDANGRQVSIYKPGGAGLAQSSTVKECIALAKHRAKELHDILTESISPMDVDQD